MTTPISVDKFFSYVTDMAPQQVAKANNRSTDMIEWIGGFTEGDSKQDAYQVQSAVNDSVGTFAIGGPLNAPGAAEFVPATSKYGNYHATIKIPHQELTSVAHLSPERQLIKLYEEQVQDVISGLYDDINTDIISGAGPSSNAIQGLTSGAISATNTYYNINRNTVTQHACSIVDASSAALSTALIDSLFDSVHFGDIKASRSGRRAVLCDNTQWNKAKVLTDAQFTTPQPSAGTTYAALLSPNEVLYRGVPIVAIPGYTAQRADYINADGLSLRFQPGSGTITQDGRTVQAVSGATRAFPFSFLPPRWVDDCLVIVILGYIQLRLYNGRHNAAGLTALSA